jgi:outer membrane murein-binding lipoprotein Lpp
MTIFLNQHPMNIIQKYGFVILIVLSLLSLLNGCGANQKISSLQKQVDSLSSKVVTQQQIIDVVKTTPAIETLRLQELAQKKSQPIINIINDKKK